MYRIKTMNKIAGIGLSQLDKTRFVTGDDVENEDGILVRSADMTDYPFPTALRAIARAGAGTNNIPIDRCSESGVVVFNTPGANANAVKELVLCALLLSSRNVTGATQWVLGQVEQADIDLGKAVEKGKSAFAGPELQGKTMGVVGLGAIGARVANSCHALGMDVVGYDPFLSVNTALSLDRNTRVVTDVDELFKVADYITLHLPYNSNTKHFIDEGAIAKMKGGVRILNLARGELVCDEDMVAALGAGRVSKYVTDFPNRAILRGKNVVAMPHLGASTPESEDNCAIMAARQLRDYLVNGNIENSVNLPQVSMERTGICRLCIIHKNIPAMLSNIMSTLSGEHINVENMMNKSRGDYAYTLVDVNTRVTEAMAEQLRGLTGIIRVRVLHH